MLLRGAEELNLDLTKSFLIGDMTSDIQAGVAAGCSTVLVETGHGGKDGLYPEVKPDLVATTFGAAVDFILKSV